MERETVDTVHRFLPEDPSTLKSMVNLSSDLTYLDRHTEAEQLGRETLEISAAVPRERA